MAAAGHTVLTQTRDQGTEAMFKVHYFHEMFAQDLQQLKLVKCSESFWKGFNILNFIWNIASTWGAITQKFMAGIYKKV